jgi:nucleoside-diphosphate-sugar epimerase
VKNIVTGATGFLGSNLVRALLEQNESVLIVSRDGEKRCKHIFGNHADKLAVLESDLQSLSEIFQHDMLHEGSIFWHVAANLQYRELHREDIFSTNVIGTMSALKFAYRSGCEKFIYVSTAYTAGRATGVMPEELHQTLEFNNVYEESKHIAENLVSEFCSSHGLKFVIARPSIIVGDSQTYNSKGTKSGLYGFALHVSFLRNALRRFGEPIRLLGDPESSLDFCPIDFVVKDLLYIKEIDGWNNIYHLTNDTQATTQVGINEISKIYDIPGITVVSEDFSNHNFFEKLLSQKMDFYGSYLSGKKEFVRSLPARRPLTSNDISMYIRSFKSLRDITFQ